MLLAAHALPAPLAAGAVLLVLLTARGVRRHASARVDRHLFALLGACAVVPGTGWVLAVGG